MSNENMIAVVRLARVCGAGYVSLEDAVKRARQATASGDELRKLCQDAHDRIRALEGEVRSLKELRKE